MTYDDYFDHIKVMVDRYGRLMDLLEQARRERDEAIEQLQQVKAQRLQAVKVLVGVDECCGECQDASENESQKQKGGER